MFPTMLGSFTDGTDVFIEGFTFAGDKDLVFAGQSNDAQLISSGSYKKFIGF